MRALVALAALVLAAPESGSQLTPNNCTELTEMEAGGTRVALRVRGAERELWLAWRGDADRASGALLLRALAAHPRCRPPARCRLRLCHVPRGLCGLLRQQAGADVDGIEAAIAAGFEPSSQLGCVTARPFGPVGGEPAPFAPRDYAALSANATRDPLCLAAAQPRFYGDAAALRRCGFPADGGQRTRLPLGALADPAARLGLATRLRADADSSFLFEDAELWADEPRALPLRLAAGSSRALLVAERSTLVQFAPWLARALRTHAPPPSALRELLEREAALRVREPQLAVGAAATRAAAEWAARSPAAFAELSAALAQPQPETYCALVCLCLEPDERAPAVLRRLLEEARLELESRTAPRHVALQLTTVRLRCRSETALRDLLQEKVNEAGGFRLLGAVVAGAGLRAAAPLAASYGLALVAYDVQPEGGAVPSAAGGAGGAGAALAALLAACGWRRAALLSEETPAARAASAALRAALGEVREVTLAEDAALERQLRALAQAEGARVFVVNAAGAGARRALAAAARLQLTPARGYAWAAREWAAPGPPPLPLLALGAAGAAPALVSRLWGARPPLPLAAPLVRALRALVLGFADLFERHEELRYDHQDAKTQKLFLKSLGNLPRVNFTFETWWPERGANESLPAAVCAGELARVGDGAARCRLPVGDAFAPAACLDAAVVLGVPALLLAAVLAGYGARACRRRAARRARDRLRRLREDAAAALLERQPGTSAALRALLVPRAQVALGAALGAGRHGCVWLATLAPRGARLAAKAPHAGCAPAEEGELLREAATLAPLRHAHVLRLVGVCVGPGPPLLLTPVARHGDLLRYLRARRPPAAEAAHVSAAALTRLAREAALALAYLASRGVVHGDVRAANCLVDERRELLLADFGMARSLAADPTAPPTLAAAHGEYYACRRRALFPVLWMAPESLSRGAFSPASDVWALGVLALELVTLGARPFGALGAAEAVALVTRGGHARLPAGAAAHTRALAGACWRREPRARPTAREVAAWLAAHPTALQPAPQPDEINDVTGFCAPPPLDAADDCSAPSTRNSPDL